MSEKDCQPTVDVLSTLELALENFHGKKREVKQGEATEMQQIMLMLRAINDKVCSIDRYIRSIESRFGGNTYVSDADKAESARKAQVLNERANAALQGEVISINKDGSSNCT